MNSSGQVHIRFDNSDPITQQVIADPLNDQDRKILVLSKDFFFKFKERVEPQDVEYKLRDFYDLARKERTLYPDDLDMRIGTLQHLMANERRSSLFFLKSIIQTLYNGIFCGRGFHDDEYLSNQLIDSLTAEKQRLILYNLKHGPTKNERLSSDLIKENYRQNTKPDQNVKDLKGRFHSSIGQRDATRQTFIIGHRGDYLIDNEHSSDRVFEGLSKALPSLSENQLLNLEALANQTLSFEYYDKLHKFCGVSESPDTANVTLTSKNVICEIIHTGNMVILRQVTQFDVLDRELPPNKLGVIAGWAQIQIPSAAILDKPLGSDIDFSGVSGAYGHTNMVAIDKDVDGGDALDRLYHGLDLKI